MNLNTSNEHFCNAKSYLNQITDKSFVPYNYIDPELYFFMEFSISSRSSFSTTKRSFYLLCALATLIFALIGLSIQSSQLEQCFQPIQNRVYSINM